MKTNDIKITQRAEYYYTAIDLFQTVHQNRSVLGVLGCKADAQKLLRLLGLFGVGFFLFVFNAGSSIFIFFFFPVGEGCATAGLLECSLHLPVLPATTLCMVITDFILSCLCGDSPETKKKIYRRGF